MYHLATIGVASSLGIRCNGCRHGPQALQRSFSFNRSLNNGGVQLDWLDTLVPEHKPNGKPRSTVFRLKNLTEQLSCRTRTLANQHKPFLVFGGDHSTAMGTWGGVLTAMSKPREFGLVWIDAHMDAHDFGSSPSGNIHGMPLAALLGKRDYLLRKIYGVQPLLNPKRVVLVGVRSYQKQEADFLKTLGVRTLTMQALSTDSDQSAAIKRVIRYVAQRSQYYGVSIDIDALDPTEAPAVSTPVKGGLHCEDLAKALKVINGDSKFVGMEIAEYFPEKDLNGLTESHISSLLVNGFSKKKTNS